MLETCWQHAGNVLLSLLKIETFFFKNVLSPLSTLLSTLSSLLSTLSPYLVLLGARLEAIRAQKYRLSSSVQNLLWYVQTAALNYYG